MPDLGETPSMVVPGPRGDRVGWNRTIDVIGRSKAVTSERMQDVHQDQLLMLLIMM